MTKIKLLYLEHDRNDVTLIKRQLERDGLDCELEFAENRAEFEQQLDNYQPDVVLADYRIPQFSGLEALALCKEKSPLLPFIFVTGSISEEVAVESLKAGAWDYVLKDNLLRLTPAIQSALKLSHEMRAKEISQEKLRASEELHRQIFAMAADILCLLKPNGTIVEINRSVQTILGYKPEELVGRSLIDLVNEENQKKVQRALTEVLNVGRVYDKEFRLTSKEGKEIHIIASASLLEHQIDKENLIIAILHDITSHKFLEAQLQKSEKQESLTLLARGIAHDFNNILTVIIGNASLLKLSASNDTRLLHFIENIEKAGARAKELTEQLMLYAKGVTLKIKSASIRDLLRESIRIVLAGSNVKPVLEIPDDIWQAEMDEGQISQVINNLLINAVQAMPNGGTVTISAINKTVTVDDPLLLNPGRYVCISVKDTGCGISPENLKKLFTPYFTTKEKGNGLGLANAYTIVKNHHGLITAESQLGVGSTFYVYLPASPTV